MVGKGATDVKKLVENARIKVEHSLFLYWSVLLLGKVGLF